MNHQRLTRRRLLEGTAGLAVAGLAGCTGTRGGSGQQGGNGTPTEDEHSGGGNPPGHGEEAHGHDRVSEPKQTREVLVNTARNEGSDEFHFKPHVTWVTVGGTVTWELQSGSHTATAYHPGNDQPRLVPEGTDAWDSGTLSEKGETYEHTFDTEGIYHYLCRPHEQFGMLGTVIVGEPHLEDSIAVGKLPENKPEEVHGKLKELNTMVREILGGGHHEDGTTTNSGHHEESTATDHHHEEETHTDA